MVQCTGEWLCSIWSPMTTRLHSKGQSNQMTWGAPSSPLSAHQEKVSPTTALWLDVYCWRAGLRLQRRDALSRGHLRTTIWIWQPRSINIETVILYFLETFPYILEVYFLPCNDTENISSTISFDLILQWILLGLFSGSLSTRIPIWTTKVTFRSHLVAHKTSRIHPNRDSQCLRVLRKTAFQWRHIFQTSVWDRNSDYKGIFFVKSWDSRHLGKVVRIEFSSCWYQARRGGEYIGRSLTWKHHRWALTASEHTLILVDVLLRRKGRMLWSWSHIYFGPIYFGPGPWKDIIIDEGSLSSSGDGITPIKCRVVLGQCFLRV